MNNRISDFDRDFKRTQTFVSIFIFIVFAIVIAGIIGYSVLAYEFFSHPEVVSHSIGESLGQVYQGFKEIQK